MASTHAEASRVAMAILARTGLGAGGKWEQSVRLRGGQDPAAALHPGDNVTGATRSRVNGLAG